MRLGKPPGDFPTEVQGQVSTPHHLMNLVNAAQTGIQGPTPLTWSLQAGLLKLA